MSGVGKDRVAGIGIDIVDVSRLDRTLARWGERFTGRLFTEDEVAYARGRTHPSQHLSARFAAKEAVVKAFGGLAGGLSMKEIEIVSGPAGRPRVRLHGRSRILASERGITRIFLSLSHTAGTAVAQAVAVGTTGHEEE